MDKSKLLVIVCLFLVHSQVVASSDFGTSPLNLNRKVSPIETNQGPAFIRQFNILTFALGLYYLDTKERLSKEIIKERLAEDSLFWEAEFDISFDMDNIDFGRKGFTRYYPFTVNGEPFIIRIFDIKEKHYLPSVEIFSEGVFEDSRLGFQIIPGVNAILKGKEIKKATLPNPASLSSHP